IYGVSAQARAAGGGDAMQLVEFDLGRFLLAGIVPGLVLCGAFSCYAMYVGIRDKVARTPFVWREAWRTFLVALPELAIPGLMLFLLLIGLSIPEASAVTVLYVVVLEGLVYRDVRMRMMPRICQESVQLVGAIFILIVAASTLTDYFINTH